MILEEDEEEEVDEMDEEMEIEEVENFGPELVLPSDAEVGEPYTEPVSPMSPLPVQADAPPDGTAAGSGGIPLTADALAKMEAQEGKGESTHDKVMA